VMPVPDEGLGEAINDRLRHAAAPRPSPSPASGGRISTKPSPACGGG
jgi:hypothetical protein